MKTRIIVQALFVGFTAALPSFISSRQDPLPSPECPETWFFNIDSFSGPGCPDSAPGFNATHGRTDQGWGSHFMPGCHTPWAWFTLPYTEASVGAGVRESKTYCELRLKWREMKGDTYPIEVPLDQAAWKLKMHRNGTTMEAGYAIDEGVRADWRFTYWMDEADDNSKLVDKIVVRGPLANKTLPVKQLDWSQGEKKTLEWTAPQCGIAYVKVRVDLELRAENAGAMGTVFPTRIGSGVAHDYGWPGPLLGISHDFEPCKKA
ncbi:hypothetical protein DPSP01_013982 [Paraphaeosphaeria sporulosa]|uniref:Concanavalin A-like lectin/glucanase n=1 Tax=Paraphaeosphaeria sporulosa TaxID=1460663 RepID=A0A177C303_9PLEO|nr:uncharacterized protein CC84DRAFT_1128780 [Paraphaeosphaeria sporulosa]OAG01262.1 hypothetical protein CC84DRAFT_1128780 [Paraphaeosphaeria sporulosa]